MNLDSLSSNLPPGTLTSTYQGELVRIEKPDFVHGIAAKRGKSRRELGDNLHSTLQGCASRAGVTLGCFSLHLWLIRPEIGQW